MQVGILTIKFLKNVLISFNKLTSTLFNSKTMNYFIFNKLNKKLPSAVATAAASQHQQKKQPYEKPSIHKGLIFF